MKDLEAKIKQVLSNSGIKCSSVYRMPDPDETRILLAFNSKDNRRLTTTKIDRALNTTGIGAFKVPKDFQRLSSAFLHLEIIFGARTEHPATPEAM
ncbi:MAG: hypothetical protein BV458_11785 [Thermoplasmata archaeon M9B2D]|nr:MAG: hypothetical protein BV458_11785 [Thermoplasmata archaeon M9B2D]